MARSERRRRRHALLIVENLPVPFDRRVWAEAKALHAGCWHVSVVCPGYPGGRRRELLQGIEIYRYPVITAGEGLLGHIVEYAVALPGAALLALVIHLRRRVDVLHVANPPDFFFPLGLLFKSLGAAFVFDHHDAAPELHRAQGGRAGGPIDRFLSWCERRTFRAADVVIATNASMAGLAVGRGGVDPARVVVVRSSVDPERTFRVEPDPGLRAGREYLVVYLGVMGPQDGVELFVRMARALSDGLPGQVRYVAIGDGSERERASSLAVRLGLSGELEFVGRLDDDTLRRYLSTADLAVGPDPANGFNELCTMNKTLEYMAMGIPLVSFDLPETRVSGGDAALYAEPNDPTDLARRAIEILRSPDRGAALGRAGVRRVEGPLAWTQSVPRLIEAYAMAVSIRDQRRA